jgi:hypothetical protein
MVNVFSFCLYGPRNPRYYSPLLENIQIIAQYFPNWKAYIYVGPDVDPRYLVVLRSYSNVVIRETGITGSQNMIRRFCAIDEPDVDIMMVRDADSLVHWRDRWAIHRFLEKPEYVAHTIRDHRYHASSLMGGLWGIRKTAGLVIADEYAEYIKNPKDLGVAHDQNFLGVQIYPKILDRLWVHYSEGPLVHASGGREILMKKSRLIEGEQGEMFPFQWTETMYCGRVDTSYETPASKPLKFLATTRDR